MSVVGFISLTPRPPNGLVSLGSLDDLGTVIDRHRIDEVIIADPDFPEGEAVELVDACHAQGVRVRIAPSTMELLVHRAEFVAGEAVPLFELKPPVFEGVDYAIKRTFDLVVSAFLLVVLSPLLLAIGIAVRLSSRGPVIYRSMRPGIGGAPFPCLKFRTMYRDADQRQADLESLNEATGALFKMRDDPRMTPVGRFLRRYSLDELPQLINVLRGEMSLVGPRPLPQRDFERLEPWHKKRYLVLPGRHRAVAGLRALGAGLRRPRAPGLPLPRALVGLPGSDDPGEDAARRRDRGAARSDQLPDSISGDIVAICPIATPRCTSVSPPTPPGASTRPSPPRG